MKWLILLELSNEAYKNLEDTDGLHWFKWDLHCHSPLDKEWYNKPSNKKEWENYAESYINALKSKEIKVAAITDHFDYDQPLKTSMLPILQDFGKKNGITILPGCELSIPDGKDGLHLIILFSETEGLDDIDRLLISLHHPKKDAHHPTPITKYNLLSLLDELKKSSIDYILIWAHVDGSKGLLDNAKNGTLEFLNYHQDCPIFYQWTLNTPPKGDNLSAKVFENEHPITIYPHCHIWASDGRCIAKPTSGSTEKMEIGEKYTWFLADPNFDGLLYLMQDWDGLVQYGGGSPEKRDKKFFNRIILESDKLFQEGLVHFKQRDLGLNSGLIAIIGPRGSGKSIFLDTIAKIHNKKYWNQDKSLPEITSTNFKIYYQREQNFTAESDEANDYVHVHQNDLNFICSKPDSLSTELLTMLKIEPFQSVELENSTVIKLIDQWITLKNQLDSFPSNESINREIDSKKKRIEFLTTTEIQDEVNKLKENQSLMNNLSSIEKITKEILKEFTQFDANINLKIQNLNQLLMLEASVFSDEEKIENITFSDSELALKSIETKISTKKVQVQSEFDGIETILKNKGIMDYQDITNEILQYENQIKDLENKLTDKKSKERSLDSLFQSIIDSFSKIGENFLISQKLIKDRWEEFKEKDLPEEFKQLHQRLIRGIEINTKIYFDLDKFIECIKDNLNGQKFRKKSGKSSEERLREFFNITNSDGFEKLVKNEKIMTTETPSMINLKEFIDSGNYLNLNQERDFLYKIFDIKEILKYYRVITTCSLHGVDIPHLSMGERGTLYLKLKLATSEFTKPIIIDQPEDDLDNDYIQKELVPLLRELKKYRQIIIATHNANLVVNAIAEQVIIASNSGEEISLSSNSVVKNEIRKSICDILEGGEDAFRSRAKKYNINLHQTISP